MESTFRLNSNDLDVNFLEAVRKLFAGQDIVINVSTEPDTTDYLLSNPERAARLLKSIEEAERGELVSINLADYEAK